MNMFKKLLSLSMLAGLVAPPAGADPDGGPVVEPLTTVRVAAGLARPVFATHAPGDYTRLFIVEQFTGEIEILNIRTGQMNPVPFLDLTGVVSSSGNERGLLGLAFHPDYQDNGYFYVNYTASSGGATVIARYTVTANPDVADPGSAQTVLMFSQPFSNHNGGWIGFGPDDGFLYISTGDGGSAGDPGGRAQDITDQLLGKMLRLDINGDDFPADPNRNYAIPAANPFVGVNGDDEIWSYGLRNPWRCSFDRDTGDLYIADVGQGAWEEIDFQAAGSEGGENYGWRCYEGNHPFNTGGCAPGNTMVFPIHEYAHNVAPFPCSVTGGYVYRGCDIPSLRGRYFFADYCSSQIWSFTFDGNTVGELTERSAELTPGGGLSISSISAFGEDARGALYICDLFGGEVFKIVPQTPTVSPADITCDGVVDVGDLLTLLGAWDPCDGCPADLNGDGIVDVQDLLLLLSAWGPCP